MSDTFVLVGPQVELALRWLFGVLIAVGVYLLGRWLKQKLEAIERVPDAAWYKGVIKALKSLEDKLDSRYTTLFASLTGHDRRLDVHEVRIGHLEKDVEHDHERISDVKAVVDARLSEPGDRRKPERP